MSSAALARIARARLVAPQGYRLRAITGFQAAPVKPVACAFSTSSKKLADHDPHHEESFEEFTARYGSFFLNG